LTADTVFELQNISDFFVTFLVITKLPDVSLDHLVLELPTGPQRRGIPQLYVALILSGGQVHWV
jgi:hypothetical protein